MDRSVHFAGRDPERLRMQAIGGLLIAGGVLGGVTVLLPPAATGSDLAVGIAGIVAAAVGLVVVLCARRAWPEWTLGLVTVLGTALITFATHEGGSAGTGTADNEMLYVWVCLVSFYFFALPHALAQLGLVALAYGWLLSQDGLPVDELVTRLVVTVATLLLAGLLVARLRSSLQGLVRELRDRARLDSLTGLLNRRALEERATVEFARSRRTGAPVAMLVADIDDFKSLNDNLGHLAGDQVLRWVAGALELATRDVDAVARLGGDEFAVLLPGADAVAAREVGERLRLQAKRSAGDLRLRMTLSVGVAVGPLADHSLEGLWLAADHAMYEAKRAGGDRVSVATPGEAATAVAVRARAVLVER